MTVPPSSDNVILGRGQLYFNRQDANGALTGYRAMGNCDTFSLGISSEKLSMKDYTQQTAANYKEVVVSTDVTISISGFEFDENNLAIALMGDVSSYTQAASSATGEVIAADTLTGLQGKYFRTAFRSISSVVIKQGATTFVAGTDYTVTNATLGIIYVIPGGGIADGTDLTADYSYAAMTGGSALTTVRGGTVASVEGVLLFVPNNATGPDYECVVYRANLSPNGELGLISDEFGKWTLEGKATSDSAGAYGGSASSPYYTLYKAA